MQIPPQYKLELYIVKLLQEIERLKTTFDLLPQLKTKEKYARQKSMLKSAVYSARIEGNPKTLKEISIENIKNSKQIYKLELNNLYQSLEFILKNKWQKNITISDLKKIHKLVLKDISYRAGSLRIKPSAIFNQAGIAIYVCPMPEDIKILLDKWLGYVNRKNEGFIPIKAALSHFSFEKIHPFLDGNGRVGRLLTHLILKKWGYNLRGLVSFEEYLDKNRSQYYDLLSLKSKNITPFVEFFLKALKFSLQKTIKLKGEKINQENSLAPRRFEILQVIKDHKIASFDFIYRRFLAVSPRLLRYDLKKLQDAGFIKKRGITKGVVYESAR